MTPHATVKTDWPVIMLEDGSRPKVCGEFTVDELRPIADLMGRIVASCLPPQKPQTPAEPAKPYRVGTIYFIGAEGGPVKIGFTNNVKTRLGRLQVGSPVRLSLLAVIHNQPSWVERRYHGRFAEFRLHGEWFELSPKIEAEIARLNAPNGGNRD